MEDEPIQTKKIKTHCIISSHTPPVFPWQIFSGHLNIEAWRQFIQHHNPQKQILKQPTTVETGEESEVKNETKQLSSTLQIFPEVFYMETLFRQPWELMISQMISFINESENKDLKTGNHR